MTNTESGEEFFDEIIDDFYVEIGFGFRSSFRRGQIFWTHVYYGSENLEFWRPKDFDETKTYASEFTISSSKKDTFNRSTPLYTPRLEIDEEFVVIRAKRRPVVLITPTPEEIDTRSVRGRGKINLNLCVAAPIYSVIDKEGLAKYTEQFVDRVRKLEFPHLFFIPENPGKGIRHSICRLDCLQVCFSNQMDAVDSCFSDDVLRVFLGQVNSYLTGIYEGDYQTYRECLQTLRLC